MTDATAHAQAPALVAVQEHLNRRLALAMALPALDLKRRQLARNNQLPPAASAELARQVRQLKRPPVGPQAMENCQRLEEKIRTLDNQSSSDPAERAALQTALEIGLEQARLFCRREEHLAPMLQAAGQSLTDQPLWRAFRDGGFDATELFGWCVYAHALDVFENALTQRVEAGQSHERLPALRTALAFERCDCIGRMSRAFWQAYEQAAALLVSGRLDEHQKRYVRCFLRYGLVIHAPWLLDEQVSRQCLEDCDQPVVDWQDSPDHLPVFYADEYIDLVAWGYITPSPDEDLELNGRNTEAWVLDRTRRRLIHGQHTLMALQRTVEQLEKRIEQLSGENEKLEKQCHSINRRDPAYHQVRPTLQKTIQQNKVMMARLRRALTICQQRRLPATQQIITEAKEKLAKLSCQAEPEQLARHEARSIRRFCRLCAHLHEPFLPAEAARAQWSDHGFRNDRSTVREHLAEIERRDPTIFQWILAHSKKMENRVHVRQAPYFLIVPGSGQMALSINPRTGTEVGRWVLPLWNQRRGSLSAMLTQTAADFRFDTSRHSGGVDWLHSETLAAAYATVRWNYRNRSRDRREKAGIDIHQTDRVNFRRHYRIFLESADDGGRKLFFKCPEAYEAFCQFIMLPPGVERCRPG